MRYHTRHRSLYISTPRGSTSSCTSSSVSGNGIPIDASNAACSRDPVFTAPGVPVAGVQKTTICAFTVEGEEKNEGHHPHIRWTKIPDLVHVYCGISSINRVFFPTLFGLPRTPHSDCHGLSNRLINTNTSRRSLFFAPKLREPPPRQTSPISLGRKCPLCPSPPIREPWEAGRSKQGRGADADKRAFSRT